MPARLGDDGVYITRAPHDSALSPDIVFMHGSPHAFAHCAKAFGDLAMEYDLLHFSITNYTINRSARRNRLALVMQIDGPSDSIDSWRVPRS